MKLKIICPGKDLKLAESFWDYRTVMEITKYKAPAVPLALPTLAALVPSDVEIIISDENLKPIDFDEKVDLVGITGMTGFIIRGYEIADEFQRRGVPVVMGGIHVSMLPDEALQHCDSVVIGEAEEVLEQVIRDAEKGNLQKIYRTEGFCDLSKAPIPRWDLIDNDKYAYFVVQTGRGCPYNCEFCSVSVYNGRKLRHKSIKRVVKEVEYLQSIDKKKMILFLDDNILASMKYAREFFEAIRPFKLVDWTCQASINLLDDDELLDTMYETGCRTIFVGIESVSQDALDGMNKSHINKVERFKKTIHKVHSHGIMILGSFILGTDGEGDDIFENMAKFIDETNIAFPMLNLLTPLPGTRLYKRLEEENRLLYDHWRYHLAENVTFKPKGISKEELEKKYIWLLREVFSYKNLAKRLNSLFNIKVQTELSRRKLISILRVLLSIYAFYRMDPERIKFTLNLLWNPNAPFVDTVAVALSFHDHAYRKFFEKESALTI